MQNDLQKTKPQLNLDALHYFYNPGGLDIGAENHEKIALSNIAIIISVFRGRQGSYLWHREDTIHEQDI